MKGRPPKRHLDVKWDKSRNRYLVIVPASWAGKQRRKWFESDGAAHLWIAKRELEKAQQKPLTFEEGDSVERSISSLARLFLSEKMGNAGSRITANHLDKLVAQFGGQKLSDVHPYAVNGWLKSLSVSQRTRFGIFSSCRTFGKWAQRYQFSSANPFESVESPVKGESPKAILTVDQMRTLLNIVKRPYMQAWIVLGGFAGLRSEEILRMNWESVDFDAGEIHVAPQVIKKTKGLRERYVAMTPAFLRWIPRGQEGEIIPRQRSTFHWHSVRLANKLGYENWPRNCLRHSFASYHLAMWEDAGKTAHQLGHTSTAMVHQNYARAVKKAAAEEWWAL